MLLAFVAFVPSKAMVYLILGLIPYAIEILPHDRHPNVEWRGVPTFAGFATTAIQLVAGNGGLFLDVFFQKSSLDRKTTVATKAICGTVGNVARMLYFGTLSGIDESFPLWAFVPAALLAIAGTMLAPLILERMTDQDFRKWTRKLIFAVSAVYLARRGCSGRDERRQLRHADRNTTRLLAGQTTRWIHCTSRIGSVRSCGRD